MKIKEIYEFLNTIAPYDTQCPWDNSGLMTGSLEGETESIILCLDCTNDVIEQAVANNCKLIISHHPVIFSGLKAVEADTPVYNAIKNDITVISAHTNLDMADGGVNDVLCEKLGIKNTQKLFAEGVPLMRMGDAEYDSAIEFASLVSKTLGEPVQAKRSEKLLSAVALAVTLQPMRFLQAVTLLLRAKQSITNFSRQKDSV